MQKYETALTSQISTLVFGHGHSLSSNSKGTQGGTAAEIYEEDALEKTLFIHI